MFPSRPFVLRVVSRPSHQLCVCEVDQDRGGRAGGDPRGASASRVKGQERPESRVCAHTVHLRAFWWKHFEISSCPSVRLHRRRSVRSGPLLGSYSCIQLEKQTQCGSDKRRALMETLNWIRRNEIFCERHRWRFHCMTWSLELFSVTKSQTIKENIWSNEINFNWNQIFKAALRNFFGLKMIQNQHLSKYITSQCSKLSPYFSLIHNG